MGGAGFGEDSADYVGGEMVLGLEADESVVGIGSKETGYKFILLGGGETAEVGDFTFVYPRNHVVVDRSL